jgi:hypothetical protein
MFKRLSTFGLVASAYLVATGPARAAILNYTLADVNVTGDPSLAVRSAVNPALPYQFGLDDGQSHTFALFDIWAGAAGGGSADPSTRPFTVSLSFEGVSHAGTGRSVGGEAVGFSGLFGVAPAGVLTWETSNPFVVSLGSISYSVTLVPKPATTFLGDSADVNPGQAYGATVYATVSQFAAPSTQLVASAPEPATLVSLAIGGVCAAGFRLRRTVWPHRRPAASA